VDGCLLGSRFPTGTHDTPLERESLQIAHDKEVLRHHCSADSIIDHLSELFWNIDLGLQLFSTERHDDD